MRNTRQITLRELRSYFGSPVAYLFMAAFLGITLFVFFWVETFFSRNVANIRPLFEWMPLLLIFLVAAVTMRGWSEERRSGTLELLLTAPRSNTELVIAKFLGCLGLVVVAILLTLPIPITVSMMGPLDWGPVIGGYIATILLAGTYIALGLMISLLTESQIVSLIGTLLIGLIFYFIGASALTSLTSEPVTGILRALSTSARFDSISRGVVDVRDLAYYLSLIALFLSLNILLLSRMRRSGSGGHRRRRHGWRLAALLVVINVVLLNVWLAPISGLRADLTQGRIYSLSSTTVTYLHQLQQPLLIRGYFSKKTHPLLAPLVPRLKNLLREYGIRGGDNVKVQIVDPQANPAIAKTAARRYNIRPVPFRVQNKYESSVVNSYFNVLIKYGNQHKVLNISNLISVRQHGGTNVDVVLNDPEYEITSAVKQVVSKYRRGGNVFNFIKQPVTLTAYISGKSRLPAQLQKLRKGLDEIVATLKKNAGDKLTVNISNPGDPKGQTARKLAQQQGIQPFSTGLLRGNLFYFNLVLTRGDQRVPVALPDSLDKKGLKKNLNAALSRFASGLLNTIAIYTPPQRGYRGRPAANGAKSYRTLIQALKSHAVVQRTDLKSGHLPAGTNLLLVLAPYELTQKQLFTIDQFMMRGGTTIIAANPFDVGVGGRQGLNARPRKTGLAKWLAAKGIHIKAKLVLDPHSSSFPIPVIRQLGGIPVRQYRQTDYPYFIDIRGSGMADDSFITDELGQLTLTWASPITLDDKLPGNLQAQPLLRSSDLSWVAKPKSIKPAPPGSEPTWATPEGKRGSRILGLVVSGRFESWFDNHDNPFLDSAKKTANKADGSDAKTGNQSKDDKPLSLSTVISHSPDDTRLVIVSSPTFVSDVIMRLQGLSSGRPYMRPVQFMRNALHWALDDPALLALRDQHRVSRILKPMTDGQRQFWEYLNYGLAVLGLLIVFLIARTARLRREERYLKALKKQDGNGGQA